MSKNYLIKQSRKVLQEIESSKPSLGTNPYLYSSTKVCDIQRIDTDLEYIIKDKINIVSISLPYIPEDEVVTHKNGKEYPHSHTIYNYSKGFMEKLFEKYKECITYAVTKYDADVIVINELGMPLNIRGEMSAEARDFTIKIANEHNCLIIAGSSHNKKTYLNTGYIFYPGKDSKNLEFRQFYKNISAFQTQNPEKIYTPSERIIYFTRAFNLGFSFMICLEVADYSSTSIVSTNRDMIDFLIVPTYLDEYGTMGKVAKTLSKVLGGVLLNNCFIVPRGTLSDLFICGKKFEKTYGKSSHKSHKIGNDAKVILRTLDVKKFKKEKREMNLNLPDKIKYLFGTSKGRV